MCSGNNLYVICPLHFGMWYLYACKKLLVVCYVCNVWICRYFGIFESIFSFFRELYPVCYIVSFLVVYECFWWISKVMFVVKVVNISMWSKLSQCFCAPSCFVVKCWRYRCNVWWLCFWCVVFGTPVSVFCYVIRIVDFGDQCCSVISVLVRNYEMLVVWILTICSFVLWCRWVYLGWWMLCYAQCKWIVHLTFKLLSDQIGVQLGVFDVLMLL